VIGQLFLLGLAMWGAADLVSRALDWAFDIEEHIA
jgi:hypothetical protein